jgi:hypothetical protein
MKNKIEYFRHLLQLSIFVIAERRGDSTSIHQAGSRGVKREPKDASGDQDRPDKMIG